MKQKWHQGVSLLAVLGLAGLAPAQARADDLARWFSQPTMTGNWGGVRTSLNDAGITPKAFYTGEFAANPSGGQRQGTGFAQQIGFGADFDLAKLAGIKGGIFHLVLNAREGRSNSADFIGNKLEDQEVFGAGESFRLTQFSYGQSFADKKVYTEVGFFPWGNYFGFTPLLCDFQNVGFCGHPNSLPNNSGWTDYPTPKWGGMVRLNVNPALYLETGVFDVNPTYYNQNNGFKISLNGSTGVEFPFEAGFTAAIGPDKLPGHYKIGAYYDTSNINDAAFANVSRTGRPQPAYAHLSRSGRDGGYILIDQMLLRVGQKPDRGLIGFVQGTISDSRTAPIPYYYDAGLVLEGPFAARPHDFANIGVVHAAVNHRVLQQQYNRLGSLGITNFSLEQGETVAEMGYGIQAAPWLLIHPNVQYIVDPGAFSFKHIPNAWVFGAQTKIVF